MNESASCLFVVVDDEVSVTCAQCLRAQKTPSNFSCEYSNCQHVRFRKRSEQPSSIFIVPFFSDRLFAPKLAKKYSPPLVLLTNVQWLGHSISYCTDSASLIGYRIFISFSEPRESSRLMTFPSFACWSDYSAYKNPVTNHSIHLCKNSKLGP